MDNNDLCPLLKPPRVGATTLCIVSRFSFHAATTCRREQTDSTRVFPTLLEILVEMGCTACNTLAVYVILYLCVTMALADMVEMQLPGTYSQVSLGLESGGETVCAPQLKISLLEVKGTPAKQLFVIPHGAYSVPSYSTDRVPGFISCTPLTVASNSITSNVSASVLRRSRDLAGRIDMRVNLLRNLELLRESYFVGYEHGDRLCNGYARIPNTVISVWFAPGKPFSATYGDLLLNFQVDDKYIFYYSKPAPCFYKADAKVVGNVKIIRSPSPLPVLGEIIPPNGRGETGGAIQGNANNNANAGTPAAGQPMASAEPRGPACFPGNARVKVRVDVNGEIGNRCKSLDAGTGAYETKEMDISDVEIGDIVMDGIQGDKWTRVIAQTHSDAGAYTTMVQIDARGTAGIDISRAVGNNGTTTVARRLTLSEDHLVPCLSRHDTFDTFVYAPIAAGKLRVGDVIGDSLVITAINRVRKEGLYAPVTASGSMRVDDVLVSCYAVDWKVAHALLAPMRVARIEWEGAMRRIRSLRTSIDTFRVGYR